MIPCYIILPDGKGVPVSFHWITMTMAERN